MDQVDQESKEDETLVPCGECGVEDVCPSGVCVFCIYKHPFHFITDTVAIGNRRSSYDEFDIVVNMNVEENGVEVGDIEMKKVRNAKTNRLTYILLFGIQDISDPEFQPYAMAMFDTITEAVEKLAKRKKIARPKILFQCYAGISRSVSAAVVYLSKRLIISTREAFDLIKSKRKIANPNKGFRAVLGI